MNCEIVCVGTELLLGDIVNTNAAWLAKQLAELGINVYYQSVVGDNPARLKNVLESAFARADLVLTTGGLGPTKDDLTKETAASLMGARLALHEPSLAHIETVFSQGGRTVTESVKKQAYLPEGCIPLHNPAGTAPGFILEKGGKTLIMLPGPPREMTAMFNAGVRPHFASEDGTYLFSRRIRIMGIGESDVADMVGDLMDGANPTVAPYAKNTETELRVTAAAATLGGKYLQECTLYVTVEPCIMCAGLMHQARIARCVYGAADPKAGALGSLYEIHRDTRLNHTFAVEAGVLEDECASILKAFFAAKRAQNKQKKKEICS